MPHLDDGSLQAWLDQGRSGMDEDERDEIGRHLATCAECSGRLAALEETTLRIRSLLPVAEPGTVHLPEWGAVVARARVHETAGKRRSAWRTATWAAGVAAVMGLGWLSNDLVREVRTARSVAPPPAVEPAAAPPRVAATTFDEAPGAKAAPEEARVAAAGPPVLRGRVTDEEGRPLVSAQVFVRGTSVGTLTNRDGAFSLSLPDTTGPDGSDVTLSAQLIGYGNVDRELLARAGDTVSAELRMVQQSIALDEIVITGASFPADPMADFTAATGRRGLLVPSSDSTWGGPWTPLARADADSRLGFPVRTFADLRVIDIAVGSVEGTPVVRIVQELEGGARLTLVESMSELSFGDDTRLRADAPTGALVRSGALWIAATGPVPLDSLKALLQRLR